MEVGLQYDSTLGDSAYYLDTLRHHAYTTCYHECVNIQIFDLIHLAKALEANAQQECCKGCEDAPCVQATCATMSVRFM